MKQENIIQETKNYDMFDLYETNRNVKTDSKRFKELVLSMKKHGFISAYPVHCVKNGGGRLKIKSGHHRFVSAKILNIPVKYVVANDTAKIYELEQAGPGKWKPADYFESFCKQGVSSYLYLKQYMEMTGIGLSDAASMHKGEAAGSGNWNDSKWKTGAFEIREYEHPKNVANVVFHLKRVGCEWATNNRFINAISKCLFVRSFDVNRLILKISTFPELLKKQRGVEEYLKLIEDVYNYKAPYKNKENIAFMATEEALKRRNFGLNRSAKRVKTKKVTGSF